MANVLDKSLCSPRDLTIQESSRLRELLKEQLDINAFKDQDHEEEPQHLHLCIVDVNPRLQPAEDALHLGFRI